MKCKKCGAELSDDAEFCPVCRSSVGGTEQEAVSCTAPPAPTPEPENIPPEEPEDYSAGAAEPVIAPVKKPRKMSLAVSAVLSVVFGMQTAAVLCTFSGALSSHAVSEQIADIDVGSIEIGSLIPDNIKEQFSIDPSEITGDIAGIVSRFSGGAMSSGQAAEIIRKADISKEIAKIVQSYEDFIMSGKSDVDISAELQRIILGAKQVYKDVTGMEVPADFDQDVINALKENAEALQQAAPQAALGVMGDTLRVVFSPAVWIAAFVLSALFPLLAGLITRRVPAGLMCGGAAYFVSGAGILITNAVSETVMKTLLFDDGVMTKVFSNALGDKLMLCGAVLAVVGAVLIAAFIVVKVTSARKLRKG